MKSKQIPHLTEPFIFIQRYLSRGIHVLSAGATEQQIRKVEKDMGLSFPPAFRQWVALTNGAELFNGAIQFWPLSILKEQNERMRGGWYGNNHLFFATSGRDELFIKRRKAPGADWYFFDLQDNNANNAPVHYFYLTPTEIGIACSSFLDWLKLLCEQRGLGVASMAQPIGAADAGTSSQRG